MAEARGRYRLGDSPRLSPGAIDRRGHALPLAEERSAAEQRIEIEHVLTVLAREIGVDPDDYHDLSGQRDRLPKKSVTARLNELARGLEHARRPAAAPVEVQAAWEAMSEFFYGWDAFIQDELAARSFGTSSAYQLGRGLAETYWALDPTVAPDDAGSWEFLLGSRRRDELTHLLDRLAGDFDAVTVRAVTYGIGQWCDVAADPAWHAQHRAVAQLQAQVRTWRDLLLTGLDPRSLVAPQSFLQRARQVRTVLRAFWPEFVLFLLGAGVLSAAAYVLGHGSDHRFAWVSVVLGSLGVSAAGAVARAKSAAHDLMARLRDMVDQDVVNVTVTPPLGNERLPAQPTDDAARTPIEHVVVLALENRSFDHLLGYLDHPDSHNFDGLIRGGPYTNPDWTGGGLVATAPTAKDVVPVDPDHSHDAVMEQLAMAPQGPTGRPTNQGFVRSYERKARGLAPARFGGIIGSLVNWIAGLRGAPTGVQGRGPLAMACQPPEHTPALSTLAREFAVCTRWFSSVPGETWPNRNFMHAATSDGETNIELRFYTNRTIFELLEEAGKTWSIYYDDTPQVWAFKKLWDSDRRHANWFTFDAFADHVGRSQLATYSFIEPNHRPQVHTVDRDPVPGTTAASDSQHPGNNLVSNDAYDTFPQSNLGDFARADALIAQVYETLRQQHDLFEKTVLLITYDEHGGLYDHVPPPTGVPAPGDHQRWAARIWRGIFHRKAKAFDFTMLGVRVPAVVVSPYVPRATISAEVRDHGSIPKTLRALFAPDAQPLTKRDAAAQPFHSVLTLRNPRDADELPSLASIVAGVERPDASTARRSAASLPTEETSAAPAYYKDFEKLADGVGRRLARRRRDPKAAEARAKTGVAKAAAVTQAFADHAEASRARVISE